MGREGVGRARVDPYCALGPPSSGAPHPNTQRRTNHATALSHGTIGGSVTATIASAVRSGCQPPGMASFQIAKRPSPPPGALAVAGEAPSCRSPSRARRLVGSCAVRRSRGQRRFVLPPPPASAPMPGAPRAGCGRRGRAHRALPDPLRLRGALPGLISPRCYAVKRGGGRARGALHDARGRYPSCSEGRASRAEDAACSSFRRWLCRRRPGRGLQQFSPPRTQVEDCKPEEAARSAIALDLNDWIGKGETRRVTSHRNHPHALSRSRLDGWLRR